MGYLRQPFDYVNHYFQETLFSNQLAISSIAILNTAMQHGGQCDHTLMVYMTAPSWCMWLCPHSAHDCAHMAYATTPAWHTQPPLHSTCNCTLTVHTTMPSWHTWLHLHGIYNHPHMAYMTTPAWHIQCNTPTGRVRPDIGEGGLTTR